MRLLLLISGLLTVLAVIPPSRGAEPPGSPSAFIMDLAQKAPVFLNSETLSSLGRQRRLEGLLEENFNMPRIARSVLGTFWQGANVADREKFTTVLRDVKARTYSERFTRYSPESFRVTDQRDMDAAIAVVYSEFDEPSWGDHTKMEWHVARGASYRVIDVRIAGASLAKVMHDDFGAYLHRNGGNLKGPILQLQTKLGAGKPR